MLNLSVRHVIYEYNCHEVNGSSHCFSKDLKYIPVYVQIEILSIMKLN